MTFASTANAGAYTTQAVPTSVELVSGGLLIEGAFGDPNSVINLLSHGHTASMH